MGGNTCPKFFTIYSTLQHWCGLTSSSVRSFGLHVQGYKNIIICPKDDNKDGERMRGRDFEEQPKIIGLFSLEETREWPHCCLQLHEGERRGRWWSLLSGLPRQDVRVTLPIEFASSASNMKLHPLVFINDYITTSCFIFWCGAGTWELERKR